MNLVELDTALRKLRLSGMATTLDARLGYKWTLPSRRVIDLALNIANLSNRRTPVFFLDPPGGQSTNVVLRPRGAGQQDGQQRARHDHFLGAWLRLRLSARRERQ